MHEMFHLRESTSSQNNAPSYHESPINYYMKRRKLLKGYLSTTDQHWCKFPLGLPSPPLRRMPQPSSRKREAMPARSVQASSFLDLPTEIRLMIYKHIDFCGPQYHLDQVLNDEFESEKRPCTSHGLQGACRQTYYETRHLVERQNVDLTPFAWTCDLACFANASPRRVTRSNELSQAVKVQTGLARIQCATISCATLTWHDPKRWAQNFMLWFPELRSFSIAVLPPTYGIEDGALALAGFIEALPLRVQLNVYSRDYHAAERMMGDIERQNTAKACQLLVKALEQRCPDAEFLQQLRASEENGVTLEELCRGREVYA